MSKPEKPLQNRQNPPSSMIKLGADRTPSDRSPAATGILKHPVSKEFLQELNVTCGGLKNQVISEIFASRVRLKGACSPQHLSIENLTNGHTASIFKNSNQGFSTDYLKLRKGENKIKIKHLVESQDAGIEMRSFELIVYGQ